MSGGYRLLVSFSSLLFAAAAVYRGSDSKSLQTPSAASTAPHPLAHSSAAPPKAETKPVIDIYHGTKVLDNYRWLEDGTSPETQKWVADELAYTRAILDPLPGREAIHRRLTELLAIGSVTPPEIAGKYYFYTKREGMQNQPILYVREKAAFDGASGPDRVLVDANQLAADGTVALDWFQPSDNGRYVAYGTSTGGSEISTLHIIETKTGTVLPDTIERTRACSLAWMHDNHGFYYTRYPKKGDVPAGEEMYHRQVFYHELGQDPDGDDPIFGEGRDPEDWPNVHLSNDGRWLVIDVEQGWVKSELFLMDLKKNTPPTRVSTGKNFLYRGEIYEGKLYITTNETAPRYRVFVTDAGDYEREHWKEIIPQSDAVLQGVAIFGGKLYAQYEQNASSQLKLFDLDGKKLTDISLPAIGTVFGSSGRWNRDEAFFGFQSFTTPPSIYQIALNPIHVNVRPTGPEADIIGLTSLWTKVDAPSIDPSAYEVAQEWFTKKVCRKTGTIPRCSLATADSTSASRPRSAELHIYGWSTAAFTPSPTCAAAPNSEKTGTAPACSTKSRTSSTT
jgi:prolyl oligopeptidase